MREQGADRLVPVPADGRVFTGTRRVRFGDVSPNGRARFDALARYLQDVSNDDTVDAGLDDDIAWVVRRTVLEVRRPAVFREELALSTFCAGVGSRWAERRISIVGDSGAAIEAATVWVHVRLPDGRPAVLDEQFRHIYEPTAAGRQVTARLGHDVEVPATARREHWPLRFVDFDALGHVNNAVSWALVEEVMADHADVGMPCRAELEYRGAIERGALVDLASELTAAGVLRVWGIDRSSGEVYLTATVGPIGPAAREQLLA